MYTTVLNLVRETVRPSCHPAEKEKEVFREEIQIYCMLFVKDPIKKQTRKACERNLMREI
jgi:hypothetical protein